jgi:toxin ParE1/3/4
MKVRFNRAALADIDEITNYIAERNPIAAAQMLSRFEAAARLLEKVPLMGSPTLRENFRQLVIGNYLMVYEIANNEAIIHYVRHGARKRPWEDD